MEYVFLDFYSSMGGWGYEFFSRLWGEVVRFSKKIVFFSPKAKKSVVFKKKVQVSKKNRLRRFLSLFGAAARPGDHFIRKIVNL